MKNLLTKIIYIYCMLFVISLIGCAKKNVVIEKRETNNREDLVLTSEDMTKNIDKAIEEKLLEETMPILEFEEEYIEEKTLKKGENKMVVAFYSASGYTKKVAKMIENYYYKNGRKVDVYEIEPKVSYSEKDLDYMDPNSRCCQEHDDPDSRPELLDNDFNIDKHEVIFIGFPVWWGVSPQIIYSFLEAYDFTGKTIVPFCTSHSSPLGNACENLKNYTNAKVLDGIRFSMEVEEKEVNNWLDGLKME